MSARAEVNRWTHGEDWRTWVAHAALAVVWTVVFGGLFSLVFGLGEGALFGAAVASGFYLLREADQVFYAWVDREPVLAKARDHVLDVVCPAVSAWVVALAVFGLAG